MALNQEITLTFKEDVGGWTTFKSYIPDWGASLNNRYYTMRLGSIWEHNVETDETFTQKELTAPIELKYDSTDEVTGEIQFEIVGSIIGLKLFANDNARVQIYNESTGEFYNDRIGYFPNPEEEEGSYFRLFNYIEGNTNNVQENTESVFFITQNGFEKINKNNVERNVFYDNLTNRRLPYGSVVEFIINNEPSTVKQFKTLGYEGIGLWDFQIYTDVESKIINEDTIPKVYDPRTLAGVIKKTDLVQREGKFFANINGTEKDVSNLDFSSISVQGISVGSPTGLASDSRVLAEASVLPTDVKPGDGLYFFHNQSLIEDEPNYSKDISYAGTITEIDGNIITYSKGNTGIDVTENAFLLHAKNTLIEKSGVTGAYAHVRMSNDDAVHAEVFTVNSEVVQSSR